MGLVEKSWFTRSPQLRVWLSKVVTVTKVCILWPQETRIIMGCEFPKYPKSWTFQHESWWWLLTCCELSYLWIDWMLHKACSQELGLRLACHYCQLSLAFCFLCHKIPCCLLTGLSGHPRLPSFASFWYSSVPRRQNEWMMKTTK